MTIQKLLHSTIARSAFITLYKTSIVIYSLYIAFSSHVFAISAEAPLGGQNFTQQFINDAAALERKKEQEALALRNERVRKIQAYYARYDLPLQYEAEHFVQAAETYNIDWRLLAAIGFIE